MKSCRRCVIKGRVQGVFFRQSTLEQAERLGITGWVRNLDDGDVECVICGDNEILEQMLTWLNKGPERAQVIQMSSEEISWQDHSDFKITR
ncbi:MAG: acylphosphatase [Candidatus Berkiella sp.]